MDLLPLIPGWKWNLKVLVFVEGWKPKTRKPARWNPEKNPQRKDKNHATANLTHIQCWVQDLNLGHIVEKQALSAPLIPIFFRHVEGPYERNVTVTCFKQTYKQTNKGYLKSCQLLLVCCILLSLGIRNYLLENEQECPSCGAENVSPDSLVINKQLRQVKNLLLLKFLGFLSLFYYYDFFHIKMIALGLLSFLFKLC